MSDELKENLQEDEVQETLEVTEQQVEETNTEDPATTPEKPAEPEIKPDDPRIRNLRVLAKNNEKLAAEIALLQRQKEEYATKVNEYEAKHKKYNDDTYEEATEDVNLEIKKYQQQLAQQQQDFMQQIILQRAEERLINKFSDFEAVAAPSNIAILKEVDPTAAKSIIEEPDIYKKGVLAYEAIKRNRIYIDPTTEDNAKRIASNLAKPKPAQSISKNLSASDSVFADLNTPEGQRQLRKELEEARKRV